MMKKPSNKLTFLKVRNDILICLFLVIATLAGYWQVNDYAFVKYDDTVYVSENNHVLPGLTVRGLAWSFSFHPKDRTYWHPLTWLSHMLDCQLFGLRPGMHHLMNLLFHMASSLLLFLVFKRMTGSLWKSAFVAGLFALHPLSVESVAWIAERKNVLSTFFWMLTMLLYTSYVKKPGYGRYLLVVLVFALGLLAKPMLVTLPFVFLLLDYWPLKRQESQALYLVLEKLPFLALSMVCIYFSSLSLQRAGILIPTEAIPMDLRLANALVSYVAYIGKIIWPFNLAFFYPYPTTMLPAWQIVGSGLFVVCVSILAVLAFGKRPYIAIGWLWYIGSLLPVSGIMQGGLWPAMADRWGYVPFIGLLLIIGWGIPDIVSRWRHKELGLATLTAVFFLILMSCTWLQVGYWSNNTTLCEHALDVTSGNYVAHNNLGLSLEEQGRIAAASSQYSEALRTKPDSVLAHVNLGNLMWKQGKAEEAINHYSEALRVRPNYDKALNNLGVIFARQGKFREAIALFRKALRVRPNSTAARDNLKKALAGQRKGNRQLQ